MIRIFNNFINSKRSTPLESSVYQISNGDGFVSHWQLFQLRKLCNIRINLESICNGSNRFIFHPVQYPSLPVCCSTIFLPRSAVQFQWSGRPHIEKRTQTNQGHGGGGKGSGRDNNPPNTVLVLTVSKELEPGIPLGGYISPVLHMKNINVKLIM